MRIKPGGTSASLRALANPAGYAVLSVLRAKGPQTTEQLSAALPEVPTSSLYRQLARLRETGVIQVTGERKARGAVERTYAMGDRRATVFDAQTISKAPVGELRAMVRNFATTLFADVTTFIEASKFRVTGAQMLAAMFACDLTDKDYLDAAAAIQRAIKTAKKRSAGASNAKRRIFYAIALPEISQ